MSKTTTRTSGMKRKHDEISSAATPTSSSAQPRQGWQQQQEGSTSQSDMPTLQKGYPGNAAGGRAQQQGARASGRGKDTDRQGINSLSDALTAGGVSLREEEDLLNASRKRIATTNTSGESRAQTQNFIPHRFLIDVFKSVAKHHQLVSMTDEVIQLAGLAAEQRIRTILEGANNASLHRWKTGDVAEPQPSLYADGKTAVFDKVVRKDVAKQLLAVEKLEKSEEMRIRRERKERQEQLRLAASSTAAGGGAGAAGGDEDSEEGPPKKKKKKADGPGVTAKNMSEETKKKLSNNVANAAAGFGNRYAWMNTGTTPPLRKPTGTAGTSGKAPAAGGGWGKHYVPSKLSKQVKPETRSVAMKDVLFVVERERGHGAGRGSATAWS